MKKIKSYIWITKPARLWLQFYAKMVFSPKQLSTAWPRIQNLGCISRIATEGRKQIPEATTTGLQILSCLCCLIKNLKKIY